MLPSPMRALGRRWKESAPDELHIAVLTGRIKKIKHLVRKGVHIESVNPQGQTPLFCASFGGDYEVVKALLQLGANPNRQCGSAGAAPIHAAAYRGSRRVLRALVGFGGDLSLRDAELRTPRDYALKQPSPLRRQKILAFFDLLIAKTLHRMAASTLPQTGTLSSTIGLHEASSNSGTLKNQKLRKGIFGGSQLSLSRKASHQSTASVWSSCVSEVSSSPNSPPSDDTDSTKTKEIVLTPNLHKSVSCHLLDQLCVTTSLPLLSPVQLQRPLTPTPAYTCGGPTVYSSFSWLGTPVTVRRPTPALAITKQGILIHEGDDGGTPDQEAVRSLLQELAFLRRLRHPGFLEVMAACHVTHPSPDHVTLVYQHVSHGSLYHHLHVQHRDLCVGAAVDILIGLVEALLFMHAHGWFHCALSSHALHLISLGNAKLGSFEHAFESQVKGVGMRAEHLAKVAWLRPWQAPEVVLERMVSVRSEVYSVAAIIWEIWAGMPPWAGIEEEEVSRRVGKGEILPPLKGLSMSLVSYLTEYGLKWNGHERELDLQEVHTMLRSLRIQCNEEERVPAVTSWGPPSIPNTPVIGRHTTPAANPLDSSLVSSSSSSGDLRLGSVRVRSGVPLKGWVGLDGAKRTVASGGMAPQQVEGWKERRRNREVFVRGLERQEEEARRQLASPPPSTVNGEGVPEEASQKQQREEPQTRKMKGETSQDSGFSTPCSRTPSPTYDNVTTARSASTILTSTPVRGKTENPKPELLPNKVTPKAFMTSSSLMPHSPPDLGVVSNSCCSSPRLRNSNSEDADDDFTFVRNAAKRAFFQHRESGGNDSDTTSSTVSSPSSEGRRKPTSTITADGFTTTFARRRDLDVVKRGLSLSNICSSAHNYQSATVFTRTTSHISLSSSSSKSSTSCAEFFRKRPPQRTISQITLTLKKLSVSSSSSSVGSNEPHPKPKEEPEGEYIQRAKRKLALPLQTVKSSADTTSPEGSARREGKNTFHDVQILGIKPASHQLTRHSSSCSLASGPSSPAHTTPMKTTLLGSSGNSRLANSHDSLPTFPCRSVSPSSKYKTLPPSSRSLSVFSDKGAILTEATAPASKMYQRRHSDTPKRIRRLRRRQEMEFEEEFIDDEFDATLYDQPHMQLSVGSSENLLDNRLSFSLVHDSASSGSLSSRSQHSRHLTSSEDDEDDSAKRGRAAVSSRRPPMKALEETTVDSDNVDDVKHDLEGASSNIGKREKEGRVSPLPGKGGGKMKEEREVSSSEEDEEVFVKMEERSKGDLEPLKSSRTSRTLEKNVSNYLPTYSIGSDTEDSMEA